MKKSILLFSCTLLLFACATGKDRIAKLQPGMDRKQVQNAMGEPKDRTFRGSQEKWVYEGESEDQSKLVVFENGKVVELLNVSDVKKTMHQEGKKSRTAQASREKFCAGSNSYGKFPKGGGCNMYGCWPKGGYCNAFGCSSSGNCTNRGCPDKIASYQCVE